jgi:hypothetical protein
MKQKATKKTKPDDQLRTGCRLRGPVVLARAACDVERDEEARHAHARVAHGGEIDP